MYKSITSLNIVQFLVTLAAVSGCGEKASDCYEGATCPIGGNSSAHFAGNGGQGGKVTEGIESGGALTSAARVSSSGPILGIAGTGFATAGTAGTNATENAFSVAGAAGALVQLPCNGDCSGATPVCNLATNSCVECTSDGQCPNGAPYCYTRLNICAPLVASNCSWTRETRAYSKEKRACVQCISDADCDQTSPYCNLALNEYVGYLASAGCTSASAPRWDAAAKACVPCRQDRDCDLIPGKHVCDAGECVQCTDINYSECGKLNGQSLVCDSVNRRCALDKTVGSGSACTPCVSDAQCRAGQLCAEQLFDNASVGRFCFWKEGDTANGAPATCASEAARPFIGPVSVKRIDGTSATLCGLRASTCVALERYKTSCAYEGKPGPGLCGFSAPRDATCGGDALGKFVCRVSCMSDNDCPANDSGSGGICDWESTRPTCLPPP